MERQLPYCSDSNYKQLEPVQKVLTLKELLEIIVNYGIRENIGVISTKNIMTLRLVGKIWNESVITVLRKVNKPVYRLKITSTKSGSVKVNGKTLEQFFAFWNSVINLKSDENRKPTSQVPTLGFQFLEEFFRHRNYNLLYSMLGHCAHGPVDLVLCLPEKTGFTFCSLTSLQLPVLAKLSVTFTGNTSNRRNEVNLLQSILKASTALKKLNFYTDTTTANGIPHDVNFLRLPTSLCKIRLVQEMDKRNLPLELLLRNPQCQLSSLKIFYGKEISTELLLQVFKQFKNTLKVLHLTSIYIYRPQREPFFVRFPVMTKLKKFYVNSSELEFVANCDGFSLNTCLPKLERVILYNHTPSMMSRWTHKTKWPLVTDLSLQLVDKHGPWNNRLPLTMEIAKSVKLVFENLRELSVETTGIETSGLRYIFQELRKLRYLSILHWIEEAYTEVIENSDHWDSLLLGVTTEFVAWLKGCPEPFRVELTTSNCGIKMLSDLRTFELVTVGGQDEQDISWISDLTFDHALFKMPQLRNLEFSGRFSVSEAMTQKWIHKGGNLKYSEVLQY